MVDLLFIRRSFDRWLGHGSHAAQEVGLLSEQLQRIGVRGFVLGGAVRDACVFGVDAVPRDVDIVLDAVDEDVPMMLEAECGLERMGRTGLGGSRFCRHGVMFDIWNLRQTWAYVNRHVSDITFCGLPMTTALNIEAVAVELVRGGEVFERGFLDAVQGRVIELNLEPLPSTDAVVRRAMRFSKSLRFGLGERLSRLIAAQKALAR